MHTLAVIAHPDPSSLTHYAVERLEKELRPSSFEVADLAAEQFDPRFSLADRQAYRDAVSVPDDVRREQHRLDRATDLVLAFPVYWWSMPALLKGWIDRVFINGWAFDASASSGVRPKLQALTIHLLPLADADHGLFERHGYDTALRTQIEHGIIDYCGGRRGSTAFIYESEQGSRTTREQSVEHAVATISDAIHARATSDRS